VSAGAPRSRHSKPGVPRSGDVSVAADSDTSGMRLTSPRAFLLTSLAIYATVFVAFVDIERPGLGIGHFYYLAIALIALGYGPSWGALSGLVATSLYALGTALNHAVPTDELLTISAPVRLVNYVAIGALLGWFAKHYRAANEELAILAQRDFVTGLPNTRAFELAIDRRLCTEQPFALLVGDMDSPRDDEDRDELLRRVSDTLTGALGSDVDVARVGGDEFAVLAPGRSVEEAGQLAARLERMLVENGSFVTFGWSVYPREGKNALTLYRAADERLYARRLLRQPRNTVPQPVSL
jgi:diguanylate cyclase (GGDEF)-like protein